eukprot:SAG31_NODE_6870_length_1865_cov_2.010193_1_plen_69_part_00
MELANRVLAQRGTRYSRVREAISILGSSAWVQLSRLSPGRAENFPVLLQPYWAVLETKFSRTDVPYEY